MVHGQSLGRETGKAADSTVKEEEVEDERSGRDQMTRSLARRTAALRRWRSDAAALKTGCDESSCRWAPRMPFRYDSDGIRSPDWLLRHEKKAGKSVQLKRPENPEQKKSPSVLFFLFIGNYEAFLHVPAFQGGAQERRQTGGQRRRDVGEFAASGRRYRLK